MWGAPGGFLHGRVPVAVQSRGYRRGILLPVFVDAEGDAFQSHPGGHTGRKIQAIERREEVPQTLQGGLQRYVRASKAPNTLRAYRADLADFTLWCKESAGFGCHR